MKRMNIVGKHRTGGDNFGTSIRPLQHFSISKLSTNLHANKPTVVLWPGAVPFWCWRIKAITQLLALLRLQAEVDAGHTSVFILNLFEPLLPHDRWKHMLTFSSLFLLHQRSHFTPVEVGLFVNNKWRRQNW